MCELIAQHELSRLRRSLGDLSSIFARRVDLSVPDDEDEILVTFGLAIEHQLPDQRRLLELARREGYLAFEPREVGGQIVFDYVATERLMEYYHLAFETLPGTPVGIAA